MPTTRAAHKRAAHKATATAAGKSSKKAKTDASQDQQPAPALPIDQSTEKDELTNEEEVEQAWQQAYKMYLTFMEVSYTKGETPSEEVKEDWEQGWQRMRGDVTEHAKANFHHMTSKHIYKAFVDAIRTRFGKSGSFKDEEDGRCEVTDDIHVFLENIMFKVRHGIPVQY